MAKQLISIGIPCFNEELNVQSAYDSLKTETTKIKKYNFEYIFVDNGSLDKTRNKIMDLAKKDKQVRGIFLSRNFGPEATPQAALDYAKGDAFILFEGDLQDPPELIPKFIKKWEEGYQEVLGSWTRVKGNIVGTFMRKIFYEVFSKISNTDMQMNAGSYGLIDKKVIDALKQLPEKYRFYRGLRSWVGFKTTYLSYERQERMRGKTSYHFLDYIKHAERGLFGFSYLVLDVILYGGLMVIFTSFVGILWYLFSVFGNGNRVNTSIPIMLAVVFFAGVQLLAIGIIGKYIHIVMEEAKGRPVYIVDKVINA